MPAQDDGESEAHSEDERDNMNRDSDDCSTYMEENAAVRAQGQEEDNAVTDDEAGEVAGDDDDDMGVEIEIGETVTKGAEEDPKTKHGQELKL